MDSKYVKRKQFIVNVLFFGITAAILYMVVKYVLGWVMPFLIGFLVSLLLRPAIRLISQKSRIPYKVVALILALLFYAAVVTLLVLIGARVIVILQDGFARLPTIYAQQIEPLLRSLLERIEELSKFDPNLEQLIQNMTTSLSDSAGSVVTSISTQVIVALSSVIFSLPGLLLSTLLSIISTVFFSMDFVNISGQVTKILPVKLRGYLDQLKHMASEIGVKYIKSYSIILSVTFIELTIGLLIIGVKGAFAVAAVIAIIDLLPVLGTGAVLIPWALLKLAQGNVTFAIGLLVLYAVIIIVRNIMEPKIVGQQIGIHPLAMLISMYVGLQIFGVIGIFVLPILLVAIKGFYDARKVGNQGDSTLDQSAGKR